MKAFRFLSVCLTAAACMFSLLCFSGCNKDETNTDTSIPPYKGKTTVVAPEELQNYAIVRPDIAKDEEVQAAISLRTGMMEVVDLPLATDWVKRGDEMPTDTVEILVGHTNRPETTAFLPELRQLDFVIAKTGNRIVITGGNDFSTQTAVTYFLENFVDIAKGQISVPAEPFIYHAPHDINSLSILGTDIGEFTILDDKTGVPRNTTSYSAMLTERLTAMTGYVIEAAATAGEGKNIIFQYNETLGDTCSITLENDTLYIRAADPVGMHFAYRYFCQDVLGLPEVEGGKKGVNLDITPQAEYTYDLNKAVMEEPLYLYVSPEGSESADGTREKPFGSLYDALSYSQELFKNYPQPIEILLMDGDYLLTDTIYISNAGNRYIPLTIRAENNGAVRFLGGVPVDMSLVQSAAGTAIAERVIDKTAASKLMMLDIGSLIGQMTPVRDNNPIGIYIDGEALTRSRWPNENLENAYVRSEEMLNVTEEFQTAPITFTYTDDTNRAKTYWSEEAMEDLYILSFLGFDWYSDVLKVTEIDYDSRVVTTDVGGSFEPLAGNRFFFFNLPEEIDVPGESYIDRENGILYYYPINDNPKEMFISTLNGTMLFLDKCSNLRIEGIRFQYTRQSAIHAVGAEGLTIQNCDVFNTSSNAMSLDGKRIVVDNCEIAKTWSGGIHISGGDRPTLTSGESEIKNCVIHDINGSMETYKPGISIMSEGLVVRNNTFYNSIHQMISLGSNDVLITHNEFYNCVKDSSDMAVIYYGRNPTVLGTEICYNYFHDIGNWYGGYGQQAIFMDDGCAAAHIHDNLFYKATTAAAAVSFHGSQLGLIENNIFMEMPHAVSNGGWHGTSTTGKQYRWMIWAYDLQEDTNHDIQQKVVDANFNSDLWREKYAGTIWEPMFTYLNEDMKARIEDVYENGTEEEFQAFLEENSPHITNTVRNNVYVNLENHDGTIEIHRGEAVNSENNVEITEEDFTAYGTDNTLTAAGLAKVQEKIPSFKAFPMDKLGPNRNG